MLNIKNYIPLRKILSVFVLSIYALHVIFLYLNTNIEVIDYLEAIKFIGPISLILIATIMNNRMQKVFMSILVIILLVHIVIGVVYYFYTNPATSFEPKGRLIVSTFGRSPGATAQIFCSLLIVYDFFLKDAMEIKERVVKILDYFIPILTIAVVVATYSRTYYLLLIMYFIFKKQTHSELNKNKNKKSILLYIVFSLLFLLFIWYLRLDEYMINRFSENRASSGRVEIWLEFIKVYFNRDILEIMFGSDLSRNEISIPSMNYLTSDVHNTYFDIMNYYGLAGVIGFIIWYIFSSGILISKQSLLIFTVFFPVTMFSSVFKYPFIFYTSLTLLFLPIYLSRNTRDKHDQS